MRLPQSLPLRSRRAGPSGKAGVPRAIFQRGELTRSRRQRREERRRRRVQHRRRREPVAVRRQRRPARVQPRSTPGGRQMRQRGLVVSRRRRRGERGKGARPRHRGGGGTGQRFSPGRGRSGERGQGRVRVRGTLRRQQQLRVQPPPRDVTRGFASTVVYFIAARATQPTVSLNPSPPRSSEVNDASIPVYIGV